MNVSNEKDGIQPELEVLLWAIRVDDGGDDHIRNLLQNGINWSNLSHMAQFHQLSSFLFYRLKNLPDNMWRTEIDHFFRDQHLATIHRNLEYSRQLVWILNILSEQGIEAIPFKGVVLAFQAYGSPELRQCVDIDILIPRESLPKLITVFHEIGFHPEIPFEKRIGPALMHSIKGSDTFTKENSLPIDVHWKIFDIFSGPKLHKEFFQNKTTIKFYNYLISSLSKEDTLIMLSAHATKHFWRELKSITDLIHLLNTPDIDLLLVLSHAKKMGCSRALRISLHLADIMGGVKYERSVHDILDSDKRSRSIAQGISGSLRNNQIPSAYTQITTLMRSQERWPAIAKSGIFGLFCYIPKNECQFLLPLSLHPLYLIIDPLETYLNR